MKEFLTYTKRIIALYDLPLKVSELSDTPVTVVGHNDHIVLSPNFTVMDFDGDFKFIVGIWDGSDEAVVAYAADDHYAVCRQGRRGIFLTLMETAVRCLFKKVQKFQCSIYLHANGVAHLSVFLNNLQFTLPIYDSGNGIILIPPKVWRAFIDWIKPLSCYNSI